MKRKANIPLSAFVDSKTTKILKDGVGRQTSINFQKILQSPQARTLKKEWKWKKKLDSLNYMEAERKTKSHLQPHQSRQPKNFKNDEKGLLSKGEKYMNWLIESASFCCFNRPNKASKHLEWVVKLLWSWGINQNLLISKFVIIYFNIQKNSLKNINTQTKKL